MQPFGAGLWARGAEEAASIPTSEQQGQAVAGLSYEDYRAQYESRPAGGKALAVPADREASPGMEFIDGYGGYRSAAGNTGCYLTGGEAAAHYRFQVSSAGLYTISFDYYPLEGTGSVIERRLLLDGTTPFEQAGDLSFERRWADDGKPAVDGRGNEVRPSQKEAPAWMSKTAGDKEGFISEDFVFYFTAGEHDITLETIREPMAVGDIVLMPYQPVKSYKETRAGYRYPVAQGGAYADLVQGEEAVYKSDSSLHALWDRSSPLTQPMDYGAIKLNIIGGANWKLAGQWIEWEISVPADGLYRLGMRVRQNITSGIYATRRLTIDGAVPFAEAEEIRVRYDGDWQSLVLGNGEEDYLFELKAGSHRLRLQVVMGDMGEIIRSTDAILLRLNQAYREILVIMGASPDIYRDYALEKEIPGTLEELASLAQELKRISDCLTEITGKKSDQNALLDRLAVQTAEFSEKPRTVSKRLSSFKSNISALGTWALNIRQQGLDIDYIALMPEQAPRPADKSGFFEGLWHELRLFGAAFFTDYSQMGGMDDGESIEVWVSTGREQAQIVNQLIGQNYTGKIGGRVNVQLVAATTLLPSIISGKGPDVALGITSVNVMDYAARGALLPLSELTNRQALLEAFPESALIPLQYEGELYGLPETQIFPMLFYRTDILEGLGLSAPETWDDLYDVLHVLSKNHMEFGILPNINGYAIFLYQNGGAFYRAGDTRTGLDEEAGIRAFQQFTNLYTSYGVPVSFDFANRFRSGEMPIGIGDYSLYNQLAVFAPEISGLWGFAPVIGTMRDGQVNHASSSVVTGCAILSSTEKREECFRFIEWWTDVEAQTLYGREQESVMGAAARYTAANRQAMERLQWQPEQLETLRRQQENVVAIPEVPGGYYTSRYVDFAWRAVILKHKDVRETLLDYAEAINKEIASKRKEFGLSAG